MSNKDLLRLENEFRDELPKYKQKPQIGPVPKPSLLTKRVSEFLEKSANIEGNTVANKQSSSTTTTKTSTEIDTTGCKASVEMDIFVTSM